MPAALLSASGSVKGSDVLLSIKARLVAYFDDYLDGKDGQLDEKQIRITTRPGPLPTEYRAEKNLAIRFNSPVPDVEAGAGRYGQLVTRTLEVWVYSQNLLDPAGEDDALAVAHLDFEELVIDALRDNKPTSMQSVNERYPLVVRFIPGGADLERHMKQDAGLATSCLLFEVRYQLPYTVLRD